MSTQKKIQVYNEIYIYDPAHHNQHNREQIVKTKKAFGEQLCSQFESNT
jgi:hypothetical protein